MLIVSSDGWFLEKLVLAEGIFIFCIVVLKEK